MRLIPDPVWPVLVLAVISAVDAILCIGPARFIETCLDDVGFPRRYWLLLPILKFAAAAGLIAGIWIPGLGLLTSCCLVAYFVVAISMHIRRRDFGRNLFLNATGMLVICLAVTLVSFLL